MWNCTVYEKNGFEYVKSTVDKMIPSGYSKYEISPCVEPNKFTSLLYDINSHYKVIPSINKSGNITFDITEKSDTVKIYDGSNIDEAREFLTIILNDMVLDICGKGDKYEICLNRFIRQILTFYKWYDFKAEFLDNGYILNMHSVEKYILSKKLFNEDGSPIIDDLYMKYHKRLMENPINETEFIKATGITGNTDDVMRWIKS